FFQGNDFLLTVKFHYTKTFRILHTIAKDRCMLMIFNSITKQCCKPMAMKNIITKNECYIIAFDKVLCDNERFRDPVRFGLLFITIVIPREEPSPSNCSKLLLSSG